MLPSLAHIAGKLEKDVLFAKCIAALSGEMLTQWHAITLTVFRKPLPRRTHTLPLTFAVSKGPEAREKTFLVWVFYWNFKCF